MAIHKGLHYDMDLSITRRHARIAGEALTEMCTINTSDGEEGLTRAIESSSAQRSGSYWTLRTAWRRLLARARARASDMATQAGINAVALLSEDEEACATSVTIHDIVDVHSEVCYFINEAYAA